MEELVRNMNRMQLIIWLFLLVQQGGCLPTDSVLEEGISKEAMRIKVAEMFLDSIDESVDPCQDFYRFTCGTWRKKHPVNTEIQSGERISRLSEMNKEMVKDLSHILRQDLNETEAGSSWGVQQTQMMFKACVDDNGERYTTEQILQITAEFGSWPVLKGVTQDSTTSQTTTAPFVEGKMSGRTGIHTLITPSFRIDSRQNRYVVVLDEATLQRPVSNYIITKTVPYLRAKLTQLVENVATELANDDSRNLQIQSDVSEIVDLEFKLAEISDKRIKFDHSTVVSTDVTLISLKRAVKRWPELGLEDFFTGYLSAMDKKDASRVIKSFGVTNMAYFHELNKLMQSINPKVLQNYLMWKLIARYAKTYHRTRKYFEQFEQAFDKQTSVEDQRVNSCIGQLNSYSTGSAIGRLYIDYHFNTLPNHTYSDLNDMTGEIKKAWEKEFKEKSWMKEIVKEEAIRKVIAMRYSLAYPVWILYNERLDSVFPAKDSPDSLKPTDTFEEMQNKIFDFTMSSKIKDNEFYGEDVAQVNALYVETKNAMIIPAGILNYPIYHYDLPLAVKYGGIGLVIGHEIGHGFDNGGVERDSAGDIDGWMTGSSKVIFDKIVTCVKKEYGAFCSKTADRICIKKNATIRDDMADNSGIKTAYVAFKAAENKTGVEAPLPGQMSKYTADQLFFMAFGAVWCSNENEVGSEEAFMSDHSPNEYRVKGTVQNLDEFQQVFNCPIGSPMAPKDHCHVW